VNQEVLRLAFLVERPLPDANCDLMVLHGVRISQGTELDTVTIFPERHFNQNTTWEPGVTAVGSGIIILQYITNKKSVVIIQL
jgi:hypothetical protein